MLVCVLVLWIGGFGFLVTMMIFRLLVCEIPFVLVVLGFVGRVYCGVGGMFPSIPFEIGWPAKTNCILKIG